MKKFSVFVLFVMISLILSSCMVAEYVVYKSDIEQNATQMMECVVNQDAEGLFELYSSDNSGSLKEIQKLFDYYDGKIVSYDYEGKGGGNRTTGNGKILFEHCYPEFDFTTDTGKTYTIEFGYINICDERPEREGITSIRICENGDLGNQLVVGGYKT